ncbi:MAG TPA: hypothetical protein VGE31_01545 [Candidatus Paceibacterota bacterium]
MSLFSFHRSSERVGVIVDIGSASVLVAIVVSKPHAKFPLIVWSHREHAALRSLESVEQSAKAVMTGFMNALLKFDGEGRQALAAYHTNARITELQCTIAAPWSYTVTKSINYHQDEPFEISSNLISELVRAALQKTTAELDENESVNDLGLKVITRTILDLQANGYRIRHPEEQLASTLSLNHTSAVTQEYLIEMVEDMHKKLFQNAEVKSISYILALYFVIRDIAQELNDICLVNITYEATEIGVVRDGILQYSTHIPKGSFSLAREISNITSVPLYEAFGYLHTETPYSFMEALPSNQKEAIEAAFERYTSEVTSLFHETGDDLSIPRQVYLHADLMSEPLFKDLIDKAAKRSIKSDPTINLITPILLERLDTGQKERTPLNDTAMLVSAQFFHKQHEWDTIEYL